MLDIIRQFYEAIKLRELSVGYNGEAPVNHIHVFHKSYPRLPSVNLPEVSSSDSQLEVLLEMRESTRNFSDRPLTIDVLTRILRSCRIVDRFREPERRTYPSGGARFPVELYIIAFNIEGLDMGAYHYNIKQNKLELLLRKDLASRRRELISPYLDNPPATIIFTSVIARSEVKYGARAYPYSLIEAGHMGQNIHLVCAELGVGSCSVSGFVDGTVKELLDLSDDEIPIYTISVGCKKQHR